MGVPATLSHCPELRELEFSVFYPTATHRATVFSITSVNIRKIIFLHPSVTATLLALADHTCWEPFDDCISALADKLRGLGNKQTLEVEFQTGCVVLDLPTDHNKILPKFREKGRVKFVDHLSGQVLELAVCFPPLTRIVLSSLTWI